MTQRIKGTQTRARTTRAGILAAVAKLRMQRNFDAITIADIAVEAGIAKGSVLAHFSDKLSILATFLATALDDTTRALNATPGFAAGPAMLAQAIAPLMAELLSDRALLRLLTGEGDGDQCSAILDPAQARLSEALVDGMAAAGLPDPALGAEVFVALVVHVVVTRHPQSAPDALADLTRLAAILYPR